MFNRWITLALTATVLLGCATEQKNTARSNTEIERDMKNVEEKAYDALGKFYECVRSYTLKHVVDSASASDIADAAISTCSTYAESYGEYLRISRNHSDVLYRNIRSLDELTYRRKESEFYGATETDKVKSNARGNSIKIVIDRRTTNTTMDQQRPIDKERKSKF